MLVDDDKPQRC